MKYSDRIRKICFLNLECKIEGLRQRMHITLLEKGISHPDVLIVSQRLDKVINQFQKLALTQNPVEC